MKSRREKFIPKYELEDPAVTSTVVSAIRTLS